MGLNIVPQPYTDSIKSLHIQHGFITHLLCIGLKKPASIGLIQTLKGSNIHKKHFAQIGTTPMGSNIIELILVYNYVIPSGLGFKE